MLDALLHRDQADGGPAEGAVPAEQQGGTVDDDPLALSLHLTLACPKVGVALSTQPSASAAADAATMPGSDATSASGYAEVEPLPYIIVLLQGLSAEVDASGEP